MKFLLKIFAILLLVWNTILVAQEESMLSEFSTKERKEPNLKQAKSLLMEKVENLWKWGGKLKKDFPGLLEGEYKKEFVQGSIDKHIEKVQLMEDLFYDLEMLKVYEQMQDFEIQLQEKMQQSNSYGLPKEVWKECSVEYQGTWMLDMTSIFWENLTAPQQREYARLYQKGYADFLGRKVEEDFVKENTSIPLVLIPPGRFWRGSPNDEIGRKSDETRHRVILPSPFYIGKYEISQAQWKAVMSYNPSFFKGDNLPVERISWKDCQRFCLKLGLRMPTEAEWEYACRAGTTTPFNLGRGYNITHDDVNYNAYYPYASSPQGIYREKPIDIGQLKNANAWGGMDFHGNVWEWCYDSYGKYPQEDVVDPEGDIFELYRVTRGGGWSAYSISCRSADRSKNEPGFRFIYLGFRIVKDLP